MSPSPISRIPRYLRTHLSIFVIPSTLFFMGALATFVKTQSFTSLVGQLGEGNISLIFAALGMLWFVLLHYLKKLRVVDKESQLVKLAVELLSFTIDMGILALYLYVVISNAVLLLLLMACTINLADFSGFGGRVSHMFMPSVCLAGMMVSFHWGFTYEGSMVHGLLIGYMFFRFWIYL